MANVELTANCLNGMFILFCGFTLVAPVSAVYSTVGRVTEIVILKIQLVHNYFKFRSI